MRYFLLGTALILLAATLVFKFYKKDSVTISRADKKTIVDIPKKLIDIGNHPRYSPVVGRYTIFNQGKNDLYIADVKPDCHCTVGEFPNQAVKPGDSAVIYLRYDSSIVGVFQSSAVVTANSDQTPLLLILRGKIINTLIQKK